MVRHPHSVTRPPPTSGPSGVARTVTSVHTVMARCRYWGTKRDGIIAIDIGVKTLAPHPMRARPTMRTPTPGAIAPVTHPTRKSDAPDRRTRR